MHINKGIKMSEKKFKDGACCDSCGSTTYIELFKPFAMSDCVIAEQPMVIGYACCGCGKKIPNPETVSLKPAARKSAG